MLGKANILAVPLLLLLAAFGNDDKGNEGTLFGAFISVVLLAFVVWLLVHAARKRA
jgi:hypothetical protein